METSRSTGSSLSNQLVRIGQRWAKREVTLAQTDVAFKPSILKRVQAFAMVTLVLVAASLDRASNWN